jgi:hypothetical protein
MAKYSDISVTYPYETLSAGVDGLHLPHCPSNSELFKWCQGVLDGVYLNACCCLAFRCPLLFGFLNNCKHFIKNSVSNNIFMIK